MIGRTLGHYTIVEKIGEGGMGAVYKARDTHLDRFVAVKILPHDKVTDRERKRRFEQEARSASALNHPNIITIYDIAADDGVDYMAMEYVQGRTLDALIGRAGLRINEALKYAAQMADALAAAHASGILHRDLKPANVMVSDGGLVKVLDFGLAKLTDRSETNEQDETRTVVTQDGAILGTIAYMSPEQAEGRKLDFRSDIFSFGSVLYEMVTGRKAFAGNSQASILSAILRDEPTPAVSIRQDVPRDLDKLIVRCLRKDPVRRVQSMADLRVSLQEIADEMKSGPVETKPVVRTRRGAPIVIGLGLFILLAIGGFIYWMMAAPGDALPPLPESAVPLTGNQGFETQATFSPDGSQVAYSWNGEKQDNFDIYVKLIGPGAPLRLTTNPARDSSPKWSPDGRSIAFLRDQPGSTDLMLIPALGGPERTVVQFPRDTRVTLGWTPDNQHLVISSQVKSGPFSLFLLSLANAEERRLTTAPQIAANGDISPSISPDGRTLAFARNFSATTGDIFTLRLTADLQPSGEPRQITSDNRLTGTPAWSPDGRDILYDAGTQSGTNLWRVPADGSKKPQRLAAVGEDGEFPAVSIPAKRLIYSRHSVDENVWRIEITAGKAGPPVRLIASTRRDYEPRYSPDSRKVAFTSDRTGVTEVWTANSDGSNAMQLTAIGSTITSGARWSPDGQKLVFLSNVETQSEIFTINASGGAPQRITNNPAHDSAPSWSHDGEWIYFGSNRGGDFQVWKVRPSGGDAVQVTRNGGFAALESTDGHFLYYAKRNEHEGLWRVPVSGGEETRILPSIDLWGNFAVVDRGIFFVSEDSGAIQFYDFSTGLATNIARIDKPLGFGLTASADGRSVVYTQTDRDTSELILVDNFR